MKLLHLKANSCKLQAQRGAMFGLDARIALAIFAVLAVVVGYLAYGRIQLTRQSALLHEVRSIAEALEAYQADMGTFYLFTINKDTEDPEADSVLDITALWDKSRVKSGFQRLWNGPYLHRTSRDYPPYGRLSLFYATGDRKEYCSIASDCYVWLALSNVPAKAWQNINHSVDEGAGTAEAPGTEVDKGMVQSEAATDPRPLYYRTVMRH